MPYNNRKNVYLCKIHPMRLISTLLIILLASLPSFAQNWKTVGNNDTTYFRGGLHNSMTDIDYIGSSDPILKMIFIRSISALNGDSSFHFYNTLRAPDMNQCIDTTAPAWLGAMFVRTASGMEYYFNSLGDTIKINTLAQPGDTWTLANDNTNLTFIGTVTSSGTTSIEGGTDSFKTISIQAYNNSNPVANHYNNMVLELTKNHGWLRTLDLHRFPNQINGWDAFGPVTDSTQLLRLDNGFAHLDRNYIDLLWKYTPGNEWIFHSNGGVMQFGAPYNGAYKLIRHDSVISSALLNPTTIIAEIVSKSYSVGGWQPPNMNNPYWQSTVSTSVVYHTDTISNTTTNILAQYVQPEVLQNTGQPLSSQDIENLSTLYFTDTLCGKAIIKQYDRFSGILQGPPSFCWMYVTSVSGASTSTHSKLIGFGEWTYYSAYGDPFAPQTITQYSKRRYSYLKAPGCNYGNKIDVIALNTKDVTYTQPVISIYPNPANDHVFLHSSIVDKNATITLLDITGKKLFTQQGINQSNRIDTKEFAPGIYFLRINSVHGLSTHKLMFR